MQILEFRLGTGTQPGTLLVFLGRTGTQPVFIHYVPAPSLVVLLTRTGTQPGISASGCTGLSTGT